MFHVPPPRPSGLGSLQLQEHSEGSGTRFLAQEEPLHLL